MLVLGLRLPRAIFLALLTNVPTAAASLLVLG